MEYIFMFNTDSTSHLELPNIENVSLSKEYAKLYFAILMFKCLKSVTIFHLGLLSY